jgi:hypothetical protein
MISQFTVSLTLKYSIQYQNLGILPVLMLAVFFLPPLPFPTARKPGLIRRTRQFSPIMSPGIQTR